MTKPMVMATCHPDQPNYFGGKCQECFDWIRDPSASCPHEDKPKDSHGRCSSCMSRFYYLQRNLGVGDNFGTPRKTSNRIGIRLEGKTTDEVRKLIARRKRLQPYNMSLEDYASWFEKQGGVCAICGQPPKDGEDLSVDHDHRCCPAGKSCGKCIRGLLCHGCNMRLGQLESDLSGKSVEYLLRSRGGPLGIATEVRVKSETGGTKGQKMARFDLIPPRALWELAETYGRGAAKYGDDFNWMKGYQWSLSFAALMRHAWAFWSGQSRDPVEGGHHLAAVAWHAFTMYEWEALGLGRDDRSLIIPDANTGEVS